MSLITPSLPLSPSPPHLPAYGVAIFLVLVALAFGLGFGLSARKEETTSPVVSVQGTLKLSPLPDNAYDVNGMLTPASIALVKDAITAGIHADGCNTCVTTITSIVDTLSGDTVYSNSALRRLSAPRGIIKVNYNTVGLSTPPTSSTFVNTTATTISAVFANIVVNPSSSSTPSVTGTTSSSQTPTQSASNSETSTVSGTPSNSGTVSGTPSNSGTVSGTPSNSGTVSGTPSGTVSGTLSFLKLRQ